MNSQRMISVVYNNDLSTYLGNWKNSMYFMYQALARRSSDESKRFKITKIPAPLESFSFNSTDFSILLGYLDEKITILEKSRITPSDFPYQSYAEARVFLKAYFLFFRILLDDLAGIIEYFYKINKVINLPKSFDDLQKKAIKPNFPNELQKLLQPTFLWFPKMKDRRDNLVHHYDTILISFKQDECGNNIIGHFNIKGRDSNVEEDTRKYIGFLLSEYYKFIDNLLDHFDIKFEEWYQMGRGKSSRTMTVIQDGISLWWAHKYGGYQNETLKVTEVEFTL